MADVKIVILNWNGREHLRRFLPSVVENTPYSVVVADNGSTDDSVAVIRECFPSVGLVLLDRNYGFAEGYNRALEQLEGEYFILLNSDVETPAGWCEPLIETLEGDSQIFAVQPKILSVADPSEFEYAGAAGGFIDRFGYPFCRGRVLSSVEKDFGQYDDMRDVFWASGACMAVRADAFRRLGGFDADFFAHMEEIDLCWRAWRTGWRIAVEPRAKVFHLGGGTLSAGSELKIYLNFRNSLATLYKNGGPVGFRMVMDAGSALVYLLSGRRDLYRAVLRAHRDFKKWRPSLKRGQPMPIPTIYRGSILLRYFLSRLVPLCRRSYKH